MGSLTGKEIKEAIQSMWESNNSTFTECNLGPSRGGVGRADVVAIENTWSPPTVKIVEVKTSRNDFLNDKKWPNYVKHCHEFYWACPTGLISRDEVDDKVGLMMVNPSTGNASVVKKAIYRDAEPAKLFMTLYYLLTWRYANVEGVSREQTVNRIRRELEQNKELGEGYSTFVSSKLEEADRKVKKAKRERREAERSAELANKKVDRIEEECREASAMASVVLDHRPNLSPERFEAMLTSIPCSMESTIERAVEQLNTIKEAIGYVE